MTPRSRSRFIVPNIFTSLNFLLGVWAIIWAAGVFMDNRTDPYQGFIMAGNLIIFCALLDKLDGFAARLMKASSEFGAQLDSLADLVAFGLAPAFALLFAYKKFAPEWFHNNAPFLVVGISVYVLAAAIRLAKYNAMDSDSFPDYFVGMPSTFAGAINAILLILLCNYGFWEASPQKWLHIPLAVLVGTGILMVSPLFLPKLQKRQNRLLNLLQALNIIVTYIFGFAMIFPEYLMFNLVIYAVGGFGYCLVCKDEIISQQETKEELTPEEEAETTPKSS